MKTIALFAVIAALAQSGLALPTPIDEADEEDKRVNDLAELGKRIEEQKAALKKAQQLQSKGVANQKPTSNWMSKQLTTNIQLLGKRWKESPTSQS
ncbi:hypothetical protein RI367_003156 [Sorochytrium milnesiophthora]